MIIVIIITQCNSTNNSNTNIIARRPTALWPVGDGDLSTAGRAQVRII